MEAARRGLRAQARFVVLDGVDGCGKSTQAARLVEALARAGRGAALHLREPGSTEAGERIRALVLDPRVRLCGASELLLFAAARRQMLDELVLPALARGEDVVCERFHASTFAYQAFAGGLDEERVLALLDQWCPAPPGTRVLLLELSPERARERRPPADDRFEARGAGFQQRVAEGFRRYADLVRGTVRIDADAPPEAVAARVLEEALR